MARSKRDDMKRKIAQAVNHEAAAILDINDVFSEFKGVADTQSAEPSVDGSQDNQPTQTRHKDYADYLEGVIIALAQNREYLLNFAREAWGLEEDQLLRYM